MNNDSAPLSIYRPAFAAMAALLGGPARAEWDRRMAAVPAGAVGAQWRPGAVPEELRTKVDMKAASAEKATPQQATAAATPAKL
jgi:hypothetical protein